MSKRYHFKPTAEEEVVLGGSVWNKVATVLNWIQGISVAAPLQMTNAPDGPMFAMRNAKPGIFPVRVVQNLGSDGSSGATASWTYDVYLPSGDTAADPDAGTLLGTAVPLVRARPNGSMIPGDSYGLAFYDGDELILWDAGEVENTGEGCTP